MSERTKRFAIEVLAGFRRATLYSNEEIAEAGGPSTTTVGKLRKAAETGQLKTPRGDTLRKIDTAAKWRDGTAMILWETGEMPDEEVVRAIGSGGVPIGILDSRITDTRVSSDAAGNLTYTATSAGFVNGVESSLEVIYCPGAGHEVHPADVMMVAGQAHRAAVKESFLKGTREAIGSGNGAASWSGASRGHAPDITPGQEVGMDPLSPDEESPTPDEPDQAETARDQ